MSGASEYEQAATFARDVFDDDSDMPNQPFPPDGDGWRLVAACIHVRGYPHHDTRPVWYWEREVKP